MAFLDNSGDIILDAVLTDVGRKKMAEGSFRVVKFALGDDEIDYGLYNLNHPSGSAYYDLEILQTPIFEAFTGRNANINYGLSTFSRQDLLYTPALVMNESTVSGIADSIVYPTNGAVYLAMDATSNSVSTTTGLTTDLGDAKYYLTNGVTSGRGILLESGINSSEVAGTSANRTSFMVNNNLVDTSFNCYFDNRFISDVMGPTSNTILQNDTTTGNVTFNKGLSSVGATTATDFLENYSVARLGGFTDNIQYTTASPTDSESSAIKGPRGSATFANFAVNTSINSDTFSKYGSTSVTIGGGSNTYNTISTIVYFEGTTSGAIYEQVVQIAQRVS